MAALTATDWTTTLVSGMARNPRIENGIRVANYSISLATTGTYPSNGVPLPAYGKFGMVRNLDYINVYSPAPDAAVIAKYDEANSSVRLYRQQGLSSGTAGTLIEVATTVTIGSTATTGSGGGVTLYVEAKGW